MVAQLLTEEAESLREDEADKRRDAPFVIDPIGGELVEDCSRGVEGRRKVRTWPDTRPTEMTGWEGWMA